MSNFCINLENLIECRFPFFNILSPKAALLFEKPFRVQNDYCRDTRSLLSSYFLFEFKELFLNHCFH